MKKRLDGPLRFATGFTVVELLVALAIGSFLLVGAVQIYQQSRQAFLINESIVRVQETAQFALDTIENDLRMAGYWGLGAQGLPIDGRSLPGDSNPRNLPEPEACGSGWALDVSVIVAGTNNRWSLPCPPKPAAQANSDVITVRRASRNAVAVDAARLQIQTTRVQGILFSDSTAPELSAAPPGSRAAEPASATHDLVVHSYYVASDSGFSPGVPTLRRKRLSTLSGKPAIVDEEVVPGIENLQLQLGIDLDGDRVIDRYVNPVEGVHDTRSSAFVPGSVLTVRVWLLVRSLAPEHGIVDPTHYRPGDVDLGRFDDGFRRLLMSKTILLRNARH